METTLSIKQKKREFIKMYLTGAFTQKDIAVALGTREATISKWRNEIGAATHYDIRKQLTEQLKNIVKRRNYEQNGELIRNLITDIEHVEK